MPLGRSFVFHSFLQNLGLFQVHLYCSGRVLHSHHVYSRCSGPALKHSHHTHPRYSVPIRMPPHYSAPVRMPPGPVRMPPCVCHDHHHPTEPNSNRRFWFKRKNENEKTKIQQSTLCKDRQNLQDNYF